MTWQPPIFSDEDLHTPEAAHSDAELITAVRGGDEFAFAELWSRHEAAARRLARQIGNASNVDDLVSEAFLRVLRALKSGSGPDGAFRPYLFSTLRRINIDNGRSYYNRVQLTDDERQLDFDRTDSAADVLGENAEGSAAWRAWDSLPDSSKTLLWHLIIEEETPAQIAPLLGTTPNGVSSRAVRAKERLRQAFLQQHLLEADNDDCRYARSRLGEYVRDALSNRDRTEVRAHLDGCARCQAALFEITDVNQTMRVLIAPIVLGSALLAGHYIAAASATTAAAKGSIFGHVMVKSITTSLKNPAIATATVVGVVAVGVGAAFGLTAATSSPPHKAPVAIIAPTANSSPALNSPSLTPVPSTSASSPSSVTPTPSHSPSPKPSRSVSVTPTPTPTSPSVSAVVVAPATTKPAVKPPMPPISTQNVEVFASSAADQATMDLESDQWQIISVSGPTGMTCTPAVSAAQPASLVHCTLPSFTGEQDFVVQLRALTVHPAPGATWTWTYTDDNGPQSQSPDIN